MKNISYDQAIKLVQKKNAILIDVQPKIDYNKKHIRNSINIPLEEIKKTVKRYIKNKNQTIILYCQKGIRSEVACDILEREGYINIYNIQNGIEN